MINKMVKKTKAAKKAAPKNKSMKTAPLAYNVKSQNRGAQMQSNNGTTRVSHKEVVSEVVNVENDFGVTHTIAIQPAIRTYSHGSPMGSWLPNIAVEYDHYQFEVLKLHYVPTCATTQAGLVVLACDPNPDGLAPETFASMKNMSNAVTGPARERLTLNVSSMVRKKLLTREAATNAYPLYDAGRLFVAGLAGTGASTGYLEVEYTVVLSNPQSGPRVENQVNLAMVNPTTAYVGNAMMGAPGIQRFYGTSNASRSMCYWFADNIHNAATRQGGGVVAPTSGTPRSGPFVYVSPTTGFTYSMAAGNFVVFWTFPRAGRYRYLAKLAGDWQNYAMFGGEMLSFGTVGDMATVQPAPASDVGRDLAGNIVKIPSQGHGWRGLRSTVTGGTDDDDFVPSIDITFYADAGERVTFAIGVRNDTNVAENSDAWFIYDTRSGYPQNRLEFLGDVVF